MKTTALTLSLISAAIMSSSAFAKISMSNEQCDVELKHDLSISPEHIRIIDQDKTVIDIYRDKMLFIEGEQVDLTGAEQQLVSDYASNVRSSVKDVASIATEAVSIAYQGISVALGDHVDLSETQEKFSELEQRINEKFDPATGHYSFTQGEFNSRIDNSEIDAMVEEVVEDMVPRLIGSLMMNIGSAVANGNTDFSQFENIGDKIEKEVEARAENLEGKAKLFCQKLRKMDALEEQLVAVNTNFTHFDLLTIK